MKAKLLFINTSIDTTGKAEKISSSIIKKVESKYIQLPCTPSMKMEINIHSFSKVFDFTPEEEYFLEDDRMRFEINNIEILIDHIEIWIH